MADLKKGLWAPTRGYFELGAAPAARGPAPAAAAAPVPAEDGGAAEVAEAAVVDEPVEAGSGGARVRLWAPTRGYFEHGGAPAKRAARPAAPKAAAAAAAKAPATAPAPGAVKAAAPAAGPKAAARPAAAKAEKAAPPPPKKDPLRDSVTTVPALVETGVGRALGERVYDEPDSETTLYKVTALNVAFAVSSALLLVYTIIVIYADYNRPWKTLQADYQAKLRADYDTDLQKAREDQVRSLAALRPSLEQILGRVATPEKLESVRAEASRARASGGEIAAVDALVEGAKEALDEKDEYARLREDARKKKIAYTLREKDLRAFKGDFQAEKYIYEERKRHALAVQGNTRAGEDEVRKIDAEFLEKFVKRLADLDREVEGLLAESKIAEKKLAEYVDAESRIAAQAAAPEPAGTDDAALETLPAVEGRLAVIAREVKGQRTKVTAVEKDWRTFIRNFPGLDFLAPSYVINKVVIPDLHEDLNFQTVPRIDRCATCHVNIDNPDPRVASRSRETWGDYLYDKWGTVYASHPRLDLFVGSASPHPYEAFGCTTCHYGDGHSTDFVTASHTPGDKEQAEEWEKKYHWHRMHHQDYPMLEKKYVTSSCLKCHPADHKLDGGGNFNLGYEVVKTYGCFGCHKMKAFEGFEKVGPSLAHIADKADVAFLAKWIRDPQHFRESTRMPRFFDLTNSKGQMLVVAGKDNVPETLDFEMRNGVEVLAMATYLHATSGRREDIRKVAVPGDAARGRELVRVTGCLGCHSIKSESLSSEGAPGNGGAPAADIDSLVRAGHAELAAFAARSEKRLADENRKGAKEETRPLREGLAASRRLAGEAAARLEALGRWYRRLPVGANVEELHHAAVLALDALDAEAAKLPETNPPAAGARTAAAAIRDRWVENTFAPDLSSIGSKIKNADWLADWIIDPRRHDPETVMPRFRLEEDPDGPQKVADIVAYLLTLRDPQFEQSGYLGLPDSAAAPSPEDAAKLRVLDELAFDYRRRDIRPDQTRDEALAEVQAMTTQAKLEFVGHRLIRRYGCFGCHMGIRDVDSKKEIEEGGRKRIVIGTFDRAQPIGTELEGWGIKEAAKLDYGHWGHQHSGREAIDHSRYAWARAKLTDTRRFDVIPDEKKIAEDVYEYYPTNRLITKTPEELLKMPLFPFVEDEKLVDAAVTFLAALVKDRIPLEKTHRQTETEKALEEGSRLIAKLNCQGCHRIGAEPQFVELSKLPRFSLSFNYDASDESKRRDEFEKETWLAKDVTLKAQKVPFDAKAGGEAGPVVSVALPKGTLLNRRIADRDFPLSVVEAAAGVVDRDSEQRFLGHFDLEKVSEHSRVIPVGGYQEGRIRNYFGRGPVERPQAPPPLVREGERVRGDWLFRFLLDVKPLRPWLRVRMPSFYLTQDEARTIVRWFRANAGLPDSNEAFDADRYDHDLALEGRSIFGVSVGDKIGYQCNSCHPAGTSLPTVPVIRPAPGSNVKFDYTKFPFRVPEDKHYVVWQEPGGTFVHRPGFADREAAESWGKQSLAGKPWAVGDPWDKVKWGPDLGLASERLRPSWLHDWIAEPQDFMPGTNMPPFFGGRDPIDGVVLKPGSDPKIAAIIRYIVHMERVGPAPSQPPPETPSGPVRAGGN